MAMADQPALPLNLAVSETLPILVRVLSSDQESFRAQAAEALGRMGRDAKGAVPELPRALGVGHWMTRCAIAEALAVIGPDDPGVRAALRAALSDPRVRKMTYRAEVVAFGAWEEPDYPSSSASLRDCA
jgi:hypothetical protein